MVGITRILDGVLLLQTLVVETLPITIPVIIMQAVIKKRRVGPGVYRVEIRLEVINALGTAQLVAFIRSKNVIGRME